MQINNYTNKKSFFLKDFVSMTRNNKKNSTTPILRAIKCHLHSSEDVLRKVWEEMTQKNTPLIVELLKGISVFAHQ
jgi:hypothetical protein